MEKWELESIIHDLQIKLDYLMQKKEDNHYQSYGTDVKYEYGERTVGTKKEIEETKKQIALYQQALDKIKENEKKQETEQKTEYNAIEADRQRKEEERLQKKEADNRRLETFHQVKQTYQKRKGHGFRKLADRVFGNGPKWKQVQNYSQEELEFVLKALSGETVIRKRRIEAIKAPTETEKAKKVRNGNWDNFTALLNSKSKLKHQMEVEKSGLRL